MHESLFSAFQHLCRSSPEKVLIHEAGHPERSLTYGEALRQTEALRDRLSLLSIKPGARVGLISENRYEWIVAYMAIVSRGAIAVPLDARLNVSDWVRCLNHAEVELVFLSDRLTRHAAELTRAVPSLRRLILFGRPSEEYSDCESYDEIVAEFSSPVSGGAEGREAGPDDVASIVYTSGTTGTPKGVMLTHRNLLTNAHAATRWGKSGETCATILPFNHTFGFTTSVAMMLTGMTVLIFSQLRQDLVFESLKKYRPWGILCVPIFLERLSQTIQERISSGVSPRLKKLLTRLEAGSLGESASKLRFLKRRIFHEFHEKMGGRLSRLVVGGAPLDTKECRFFQLMGVQVLEGYGLTETSPIITCNFEGREKVGSVGRPLEEAEVRVTNLGSDGVGEICVRGPMVMKGYFRNPEETRRVLDDEGWFRTGDLGWVDDDGFLHVFGRIKDLIVTPNGKKIAPQDLEHLFSQISLVKEVCVLGLPRHGGGSRGETVHVEIVPDLEAAQAKGVEDAYTDIRREVARISDTLPEFMRPRSVGFSQEPFPRTATLKIKKFAVRQKIIEASQSHVAEKASSQAIEHDPLLSGPVGKLTIAWIQRLQPSVKAVFSNSHFTYDLGMESLVMVEFWSAMEKAFASPVPPEKLQELKEIGKVVEYFSSLPESAAKAEEALHALQGRQNQEEVDIFSMNAERSREEARRVLASCRRSRPLFLAAFGGLFKRLSSLQIAGLENLPGEGPYILAPNHESYLDNIFVASLLPRAIQNRMAVIGAKEFFDKALTRVIAKLCRTIPVDRENVSGSVMQIGAQVLQKGQVLLAHPEGTRSADGELLPFKRGVALLASYVGCPIVPVFVEGAHEFWPKNERFPRLWRKRPPIKVRIGEPLRPQDLPLRPDETKLQHAERLTRLLRERVAALRDGVEAPPSETEIVEMCLVAATSEASAEKRRVKTKADSTDRKIEKGIHEPYGSHL